MPVDFGPGLILPFLRERNLHGEFFLVGLDSKDGTGGFFDFLIHRYVHSVSIPAKLGNVMMKAVNVKAEC